MVIKPFRSLIADLEVIPDASRFFGDLPKQFTQKLIKKHYSLTHPECYLVYRIVWKGSDYFGLICATSSGEIDKNIMPHENTIAHKEKSTQRKIGRRHMMLKPVLYTYEPVQDLQQLMVGLTNSVEADLSYTSENGDVHQLFAMKKEADIRRTSNILFQINRCFIADGHHRTAAIHNLYTGSGNTRFPYFFTSYFDFDNLMILPFHRWFRMRSTSIKKQMEKLKKVCKIKPANDISNTVLNKKQLILIHRSGNYFLKWRKKILRKHQTEYPGTIPPQLLNDFILEPIFGFEDVTTTRRINYTSGMQGCEALVDAVTNNKNAVGFCLPSIEGKDFIAMSEGGRVLPPKSTWFEPRLQKGICLFDEKLAVK